MLPRPGQLTHRFLPLALAILLAAALPLLVCPLGAWGGDTNESRSLVLVLGAPGEPEYEQQFSDWADLWQRSATNAGLRTSIVGKQVGAAEDDRGQLLQMLAKEASSPEGELWLVFIGHGTFDGRSAKFNLRGPDLSAEDLSAALKGCARPLALVQCASAAGPFLSSLSATGRVVLTATRSGYEANAARFGGYLARAIAAPAADLDKDGQTSLLEAYVFASREVDGFYKDAGRLTTEHALLDDNGDGLGTPAEWFRGVRAVKSAADGKTVDGVRAHQFILVRSPGEQELSAEKRARRDELEQQLSALRSRKAHLKEDEYYGQLEPILVEIARLCIE